MRLRQVALVAAALPPVKAALFELLGLDDAFVDEGVSQFGLQNIVMTIGTTFLEVVSPIQAAAQRLSLPVENHCISLCGAVFNFSE